MAITFLTAGESHGEALLGIIEGFPAGLPLDKAMIDAELARRQQGHGRGRRMQIERDEVEILSGVRGGITLGGPIGLLITNRDWKNWHEIMATAPFPTGWPTRRRLHHPRPGHADLAGGLKYGHTDLRNVLERASARETAMRVAIGACAKALLASFGIMVRGHVTRVGNVALPNPERATWQDIIRLDPLDAMPCIDPDVRAAMIQAIDDAASEGDTLGGQIEVRAHNIPPGLGTYAHWERRLDSRIAAACLAIPAVKGVFIGTGPHLAGLPGSQVHDEIYYDHQAGYHRRTNRAGGIEGGITNGEDILVQLFKKPLPTLKRRLQTVDIDTGQPHASAYERSDTCAIVPAVVIAEAALAWVLADAFLDKFGADTLPDITAAFNSYRERIARYPHQQGTHPEPSA